MERTPALRLTEAGGASQGNLNGLVMAKQPYVWVIGNAVTRYASASQGLNEAKAHEKMQGPMVVMEVAVDPKLTVDTMTLRDMSLQVDGQAAPQTLPSRDGVFGYAESGNLVPTWNVQLPESLQPKSTVALFSGVLVVNVTGDSQTWTVPDLLAGAGAKTDIGGTSITLTGAKFDRGDLKVDLDIASDGPLGEGGLRKQLQNGLVIRAANEEVSDPPQIGFSKLPEQGLGAAGGRQFHVELSFFDRDFNEANSKLGAGPISLEWKRPSTLTPLEIPFEIRNFKVP